MNGICRDLLNDVSYVGLSENFKISTCLKDMEKYGKLWKNMEFVLSALL